MMSFLDRFFSRNNKNQRRSANKAMERLRFVLVTDRSNLSPEQLSQMQREIVEVIKKYCRVDEHAVDIKLEQRERENYLVADIPLARDASNQEGGSIEFTLQTLPADDDAPVGENETDEQNDKEEPETSSEPVEPTEKE